MAQNKLAKLLKEDLGNVNIQSFAPFFSPIIEETLEEHNIAHYRKRTFLIPSLLIWLVVAMTVRRDLSYHKLINWIFSKIRWKKLNLPAKLIADGAISHARAKLAVNVFVSLFRKMVGLFGVIEPDFHGFVTLIFDGVVLNMPDSKSNEKRFKKSKNKKNESAFPQLRLVALMARTGRLILDLAYASIAGKGTGERTLVYAILQRVNMVNAIFLFDAGFYSFFLLHSLIKENHHFIMKVS